MSWLLTCWFRAIGAIGGAGAGHFFLGVAAVRNESWVFVFALVCLCLFELVGGFVLFVCLCACWFSVFIFELGVSCPWQSLPVSL